MSDDTTTTETPTISPEEIAATGATGVIPETPSNVIPLPTQASSAGEQNQQTASDASVNPAVEQTDKAPASISELVSRVDLKGVQQHDIIVDLIAGIQQLGVRATIALGLLERLHVAEAQAQENVAQTPESEPQEAPAETSDAEETTA